MKQAEVINFPHNAGGKKSFIIILPELEHETS